KATFDNSAAFGTGAVGTRANQQVFGTAASTYTLAGLPSAASKAAQFGPTQLVTSDAAGNLATTSMSSMGIATMTDVAGINSRIASINTEIAGINSRLTDIQTEERRGIAAAVAIASPMTPTGP